MTVKELLESPRQAESDGGTDAIAVTFVGEQTGAGVVKNAVGTGGGVSTEKEGRSHQGAGGVQGREHGVLQFDRVPVGDGEIGDHVTVGGGIRGRREADTIRTGVAGEPIVGLAAGDSIGQAVAVEGIGEGTTDQVLQHCGQA